MITNYHHSENRKRYNCIVFIVVLYLYRWITNTCI